MFAWVLLACLLVGLGLLLLRGDEKAPSDRVFTAFWLGYLAIIAALQIWHLFAPVGAAALVALGVTSMVGIWLRGKSLLPLPLRGRRWLAAGCALFTLWLADRALGPPVGDSGLYHLSAVRWFSSFAIVPGLANLHARLGFNNPSLLFAALLETGPLRGRSSHFANSLLLLAIGLRSLLGVSRCLRAQAKPRDLFAALLLPAVMGPAVTEFELRVSSPDPDTVAAVVLFAAATELVDCLTDRHASGESFFAATALAVLASCLKVSMAPWSAGFLVLAFASRTPRDVGAWAAVSALLVIPWLIRGAVLSGYPLFPLHVAPLPVDWRLPPDLDDANFAVIRRFFMPLQMRGSGEGWVRPWLLWQITRLPELVLLPAAICALSLSLLRRARRVLWLLAPSVFGAAVWWATAPNPRFAYGLFWSAAAAAMTAACFEDLRRAGSGRRALLLAILLGAPLFPPLHRVAAWLWLGDRQRAAQALLLPLGPDHGFHPTPIAALHPEITRSGLTVWVPKPEENLVWDSPLPATPSFKPRLRLRGNGLQSGFALTP